MAGEKRTKKFESRKLQATIKKRRVHKAQVQKTKQRERKREANRDEAAERSAQGAGEGAALPKADGDMGFDAFIGSGEFARELQAELERAGDASEESDEDAPAVAGDVSADGAAEEPVDSGEEDGSADEHDDDDDDDEEEGVDALAKHKAQLEELRRRDPEFVRHLEQSEPGLLDFDDDANDDADADADADADDDEAAGDGEEEEEEEEEAGAEKRAEAELPQTAEEVQALGEAAVSSLPALKRLLRHFATAAQAGRSSRPALASRAFDALLALCLTQAPELFAAHLGADLAALTAASVARAGRWSKLQRAVKGFLGHVLHLLSALSEPALLAFALAHTRRLSVFFAPFPRMATKYVKLLLAAWAAADSAPALAAFLALRDVAAALGPAFADTCLRHAYLTYVRHAAFPSPQRVPALQFMLNGLAELVRPAPARAYALAFVSLRELAILMRRALHAKTQEALRRVQHWAYLHALRVWARLITEHAAATPQLALLTYPLLQLLDGLLLLSAAPALFPLRLHAARLMLDVSAGTGVFASPLAALLEVLDSPLVKRKARLAATAQTRPPDLAALVRAPPSVVDTRAYQEAVLHATFHLLLDFAAAHAASLAFPELAAALVASLRKWLRSGVRAPDAAPQARQLVERLEAHRRWLLQRRAAAAPAPADDAACAAFLADPAERAAAPIVKFAAQYGARHLSLAEQRDKRKAGAQGKKAAAAAADGADEADEEESGAKRKRSSGKAAKAKAERRTPVPAAAGSAVVGDADGADDVVEELQLSDADE